MQEKINDLRRVAVAAHPQLAQAIRIGSQVTQVLQQHGLQVTHGLLYDDELRQCIADRQVDLLIALGGDGTMLRAGHLCGPVGVPILGINVGHFGFLMEIQQGQWREMVPHLLAGEYWLEQRMMLSRRAVARWRAAWALGSA